MNTVSDLTQHESDVYPTSETRVTLNDCFFLMSIILVSIVFYLPGLGFYSDDWIFLSLLQLSDDQSLRGLYDALYAGDIVIRQRPFQMVYLVLFYWLFGLTPIYYHLANAIALIANGVLLYLVVRELGQNRFIAVSIALVYLLLPHYSTDRFWVAAHQATFSITFYLVSLYADIKATQVYPHWWLKWKLIGLAGLILSGLSYEVTIPLLIVNPVLVWFGISKANRRGGDAAQKWQRFISLFAPSFVALGLIIAFKALVTIRTNVETDLLNHLAYLVLGAFRVNFFTYGVGLPYIISWILSHQPNYLLLAISAILGLFIFRYLYLLTGQAETELSPRPNWWMLILAGLAVFGLGYAIFLFNADVWFTSTSLGNRIAIAAAMGVAIVFVGLAGWISTFLPKPWMRIVVCLFVSLLSISGFLIINTLASFWSSAYQSQQSIINDIRQNVATLPSGSTFILDGVCLERGGAYLFTGKRDLTSVLWMAYGDSSLRATVLASSAQIGGEGLSILTYKKEDLYPYSDELFIYNFAEKRLYPLTSAAIANQYFERTGFVPERDCPPGFAWGWNDR